MSAGRNLRTGVHWVVALALAALLAVPTAPTAPAGAPSSGHPATVASVGFGTDSAVVPEATRTVARASSLSVDLAGGNTGAVAGLRPGREVANSFKPLTVLDRHEHNGSRAPPAN